MCDAGSSVGFGPDPHTRAGPPDDGGGRGVAGEDGAGQDEEAVADGLVERTVEGTRERLAALDDLAVHEHVAVFDDLHRELSGVLAALDRDEPGAR
jgi:hypothetical protein